MSDITIDVAVDASVFFQMQAYADKHDMEVSDVVARAWTLYRDMVAMRDNYNVPRAMLERYQDAQAEPTLAPCPYCNGLHERGTVEQCPMKPK